MIDGLIEPALQRLDEVLSDQTLLEAVSGRLAQRWSQSRTRGRPGTPDEVVLRMLVLKRVKGWSFDETEREVRSSLVYRYVVRVYFEPVPDNNLWVLIAGLATTKPSLMLLRVLLCVGLSDRWYTHSFDAGVAGGQLISMGPKASIGRQQIRRPTEDPLVRPQARAGQRSIVGPMFVDQLVDPLYGTKNPKKQGIFQMNW